MAARNTNPDSDLILGLHRENWAETFEPRIMSLLLALQHVHVAETVNFDWVMSRHRLSLAEFDALATLRRSTTRELTPSELQRSMVITSGGLSKVIQQLEARGLVARSTTEADRRVKPVSLTAKGARLIEQAMAELIEAARRSIQPRLTSEEIDQLVDLLEKLAERADEV
ncbi:MAG: MarR family transcriptional regulator [Sterolibacterium sp.]|jgi:DNA-binding MarR family transcriptional regulator|nr:MarR family transcriptional regulator [Sterolibacterium sp.]